MFSMINLEFPGAVPRTFVGPLVLALSGWTIMAIVRLFSTNSSLPKGLLGQSIGMSPHGVYLALAVIFCPLGGCKKGERGEAVG
jgi:hypothetical protein